MPVRCEGPETFDLYLIWGRVIQKQSGRDSIPRTGVLTEHVCQCQLNEICRIVHFMNKQIIIPIVLSLAMMACQSDGKIVASPETHKQDREAHAPGSGSLFDVFFKKKASKGILLPPDLISDASNKARENHEQSQSLRNQVLPEVVGAEVVIEDGVRWLRVEDDAQAVWDKLIHFWADLQVGLENNQPSAGMMQTEWIDTSDRVSSGGFSIVRLFNRITGIGSLYDRYQIRLEREADEVTRVFVSHQSTERQELHYTATERNSKIEWVSSQNEEKAAQLLQVIVLLFQETENST